MNGNVIMCRIIGLYCTVLLRRAWCALLEPINSFTLISYWAVMLIQVLFFGLGIPVVSDKMHLSSVMALIHRIFFLLLFIDARFRLVRKTVLYIPLEALQHSSEVAARDKELVKRLEGKDQERACKESAQFM